MLDLEKLNYKERESYQNILDQYKIKQLSIVDFKDHVTSLLFAVIRELVEIEKNQDEKNTYLKARAKNYLVMLDILTAPEMAEKQMREAMGKMEKRVK
jgi:hypothetical protein